MSEETTKSARRPWVANGPEDRFSIAVDRLLRRTLTTPYYAIAARDEDGGERTVQQRVRDSNRGRKKGMLDWDVVQPGVWRKLELKRGKNGPSEAQKIANVALTACGFPPIIAWTLREVYDGMVREGFRFTPNVETVLQHYEAILAGWDREADLITSGQVVKKRAAPRKPGPRFLWAQH